MNPMCRRIHNLSVPRKIIVSALFAIFLTAATGGYFSVFAQDDAATPATPDVSLEAQSSGSGQGMVGESILKNLDKVISTFVLLLIVIFIMTIIAERMKLPYTIVLVLAGLFAGWVNVLKGVSLSHDLVFFLFLPPLLFEGAIHLKLSHLKANLTPIVVLATVGVALAIVLTGWLVQVGTGLIGMELPIILCLLFGSLISATDPVSVLSIVKKMGAPKRLGIMLEGEALFNDGTAVVFFTIIHSIAAGGLTDQTGNWLLMIWSFIKMVAFGGLIGFGSGYIASKITRGINDHLIEITLSTIVAFGTFLLAEYFHVSGVIAVVTAGIVIGNIGFEEGMSPTTRLSMRTFWEYMAFLINSLVFLLVGIQVEIADLARFFPAVVVAIISVLLARALVVYALVPILSRYGKPIPASFSHVLIWGGLRGALSMALALSLSPAIDSAYRLEILEMTFGVAVFSLLVQGLTVSGLVKKLGLAIHDPARKDMEMAIGRLSMQYGALEELAKLHNVRQILPEVEVRLRQELKEKAAIFEAEVERLQTEHSGVVESAMDSVRYELLKAAKSDLLSLMQAGTIGDDVYKELSIELDGQLDKIKMLGEE